MKKYSFVFLVFLAACSMFNEPSTVRIPTAIPGAIDVIVAQTAAAAFTQTAISIPATPAPSLTPLPSQTASITPANTPTFIFILPTSTGVSACPFGAPYYVRVRPFAVGSKNWNTYIPNYPPDAPYGYPATLFLQHVLNQSAWTVDVENISLPIYWMEAMAKLNGSGWKYLLASWDGTFFGGNTLGVDTFPGNVLQVTGRKFRRGECWDSVSSYPYSDVPNGVPDLVDLPAYQLGLQTGMNYSTPDVVYPAPNNDGNIFIPILSRHGDLWIEDDNVEAFPSLPMDIIVTAKTLDITSEAGTKNPAVIETVSAGAYLRLTGYFPVQRNTFGQVTDPSTGNTGYISLYEWSAYMTGSYTTTWQMQTLPVPPG